MANKFWLRWAAGVWLAVACLGAAPLAGAADRTWTNSAASLFNNPFSWVGGVPGAADNAIFNHAGAPLIVWTNSVTNANAFFRQSTIQQNIGTNFWLLTDSYILGQNTGQTSLVVHIGGELRVTNSAGTARMVIGQDGRGTYILQNGSVSVVADQLFVTNVTASATNSTLLFQAGTLTINRGSIIKTGGADFRIGTATNQTATLNILGGTNLVDTGTAGDTILGGATNGLSFVNVTGLGTVWSNSSQLIIGDISSGNRLGISNGAVVRSASGKLGTFSTASNNGAVVTGTGSLWTNTGDVRIGGIGGGNQLVVSNGGVVANVIGILGDSDLSDGNRVTVTGAGSLWTNSSSLFVGNFGSGNQLVVSNGGVVRNTFGTIGSDTTASNNQVTVADPGSLWINSASLRVGSSGSGNQLVVSNGGTVSATNVIVGLNASSTNNRVRVDSGTLRVTNAGGTGPLDIRRGTNVLNAGLIETDRLLLTNSAGFFDFNGGTLVTRGGTVSNGQTFVVGASGTNAAILDVRAGVPLGLSNGFTLGANTAATGNRLLITNGGTLNVSGFSVIGTNAASSNNVAVVAGAGSLWTNSSRLTVGDFGSGNLLVVSNGGVVVSDGGWLGLNSNANNNVALVTGANSLWTSTNVIVIGFKGSGNQLVVSDGGVVRSDDGLIGNDQGASNNLVVVTGTGSVWSNKFRLRVGNSDSANQLVVSNGGTVSANALIVSVNTRSTNNRVTVDGGTLRVTNLSGIAALDIRRGTNVLNAGLIETDNLLLTNSAGFFEFNGGTLVTRTATISNGQDFIVGRNAGFAPATWDVRSNAAPTALESGVVIGANASGATLLITNGAILTIANGDSRIGVDSGSTGNRAVVAGAGSAWKINGNLTVGDFGSNNLLVISNGGMVANAVGNLGVDFGANGNQAIVTGSGSVWSNFTSLVIGDSGAFNSLLIANGGRVHSGAAEIGIAANGNQVTVTGSGSLWTNDSMLLIGNLGASNALFVTGGGQVASETSFIGYDAGNNAATVTGPNSRWINSGELYVGSSAGGNVLVVSNGGNVSATNVTMGATALSQNNRLVVAGGSLLVTNASGTGRLDIRRGTNVLNAGLIETDRLLLTNGALSRFEFNGGTLNAGAATVSNGALFTVGNGTSVATLNFTGSGTRTFANGLRVAGSGTVMLSNGLVDAGFLTMTNAGGTFTFNGGTLITRGGFISNGAPFIVGPIGGVTPATWDVRSNAAPTVFDDRLFIGSNTANATLLVTNGGSLVTTFAVLGAGGISGISTNNKAVVSGVGSVWTDTATLGIGGVLSGGNGLTISNGGRVAANITTIGLVISSSNNQVVVTGPGSVLSNATQLSVGTGPGNLLVVSNGGTVFAPELYVGFRPEATNNRVLNDGGTIVATNIAGTGLLDIRRGTNVLNAGLIATDNLLLTNGALSRFDFNGGTLSTRGGNVSNGLPFIVGNGTSVATYRMSGVSGNIHSFANTLVIASNATLTGNGSIVGTVTNLGTIAPGNSAGSLTINGSLFLTNSSLMSFELGGLIATNDYDVVNVTNFVQFAGTLSLSLLGNFLPAPANTFTLVSFGSASGSFANISGGRVSLGNNLASFAVTQSATNLVLSGVTYIDSDGDGQGDLPEQAAGTDANDPRNALAIISITRNGSGHNVVQFQSVPAKNYRVEFSNDLVTWQTVPGASFTTPAANVKQWVDDGTHLGGLPTTPRFYRIGLQ